MTVTYAIVAFPAFDAPQPIEAVRRAFDPQASLLPAHITLVFPFVASRNTVALREHIDSALQEVSRFEVTLAPPSAEQEAYLFMRVQSGRERIVDLHDRLYSGPLQRHLSPSHPYEPHVTVGHLASSDALAAAVAAARETLATPLCADINSVALFCIKDAAGRIEFTVPLVGLEELRSSSKPSAPNER